MKKLLITLLLISPFSFADQELTLSKLIKLLNERHNPPWGADWGDVFNCKTTSHNQIWHDGSISDLEQEIFLFTLDEAKKRMVFSKGLFYSMALDFTWTASIDGKRNGEFRAHSEGHTVSYSSGTIQIVRFEGVISKNSYAKGLLGAGGMRVVTADCEKF